MLLPILFPFQHFNDHRSHRAGQLINKFDFRAAQMKRLFLILKSNRYDKKWTIKVVNLDKLMKLNETRVEKGRKLA